jgi:hypothetical protein
MKGIISCEPIKMTLIVKISPQTTSIGDKTCLLETNLQFLLLKRSLFLYPQCPSPVFAYSNPNGITSIKLEDDDEGPEVATEMVGVLQPDWNGLIDHDKIGRSHAVKPRSLRVELDNHHHHTN